MLGYTSPVSQSFLKGWKIREFKGIYEISEVVDGIGVGDSFCQSKWIHSIRLENKQITFDRNVEIKYIHIYKIHSSVKENNLVFQYSA